MKKSSLLILIYIIGIIVGAIFLGIWDAETTLIKALSGVIWTALFAISLYFAEKKDNQ